VAGGCHSSFVCPQRAGFNVYKKKGFYFGIPSNGASGGTHGGAHTGAHGAAGIQVIDGTGTGTPATSDGKPETYTPGEPAYEGPATAQLGKVPAPKGGRPAPITPEPHRGTPAPTATAPGAAAGPHPQGSPFRPNPGPKKFAIEGADTKTKAAMLRAITNAFLAISINPPL